MRRTGTLPLILLLLLTAVPVAEAATRWQRAQVVSAPGGLNPVVRMDSRGRALVVWQQIRPGEAVNELRYAWREPRARFGKPRVLGVGGMPPSYPDRSIALSANGVAIAAYLAADGRIAVARAEPGRPFGSARSVGDPDVPKLPPAVASDDEGRAVVTWSESHGRDDSRVMAAFVERGGSLGAPVLVGSGQAPAVAMNPAGAAVIGWQDASGRPLASVRPPAGEFTAAVTPPVQGPASPRVAIDARGRAVVAGSAFAPPGGGRGGTTFSVSDQGGTFGDQRLLDTDGIVEQLLAEPDGSVDFVSNRPGADGTGGRMIFASRRSDGRLVGPADVSGPGACAPQLAVARGGDLLVTWTALCLSGSYGTASRAAVRLRAAGGRFGRRTLVGLPGAQLARGAVTDGDEAVVVYTHGPTATVQAVVREDRGDDPLPPVPELDVDLPGAIELPDVGSLELPVRCRRACSLRPSGLLHAGARTLSSRRGAARRLRRRARTEVAVQFGAEARAAAEDALKAGDRAWISVSLVVRGDSPRPLTITRRIEVHA